MERDFEKQQFNLTEIEHGVMKNVIPGGRFPDIVPFDKTEAFVGLLGNNLDKKLTELDNIKYAHRRGHGVVTKREVERIVEVLDGMINVAFDHLVSAELPR